METEFFLVEEPVFPTKFDRYLYMKPLKSVRNAFLEVYGHFLKYIWAQIVHFMQFVKIFDETK